jgi:uncharacterized membrane protein YfcA
MQDFYPFLSFAVIGFVAQMIDGGLGMGFGITSNTILLSLGIPPAVSSASVHTSEIFTSGVSSYFHWKQGNVEKKLFQRLVITGVIGGIAGASLLTHLNGAYIKPIIAFYLLFLGFTIVRKSFHQIQREDMETHFYPIRFIGRNMARLLRFLKPKGETIDPKFASVLGGVGGFLDAIGGGGWGPVVTSTLVFKDHSPRHSIGSANAAEFFVTTVTSFTFLITLGVTSGWQIIAGLLVGGGIASPISASLCRKIPPRFLMLIVGLLIMGLSGWTMYSSFVFFRPWID